MSAMIRDTSIESLTTSLRSFDITGPGNNASATPPVQRSSRPSTATSSSARAHHHRGSTLAPSALCTQELVYAQIFNVLAADPSAKLSYVTACLLEYMASVAAIQPVQSCLHELLADLLVRDRRYAELHQYVQYNVVGDSLAVAHILLSTGTKYRPFEQLGLDMLKRLDADVDVAEILLARGQVLDALRYTMSRGVTGMPVTHFLEAALATGDKSLFLNTYKCLEDRGLLSSDEEVSMAGLPPGTATGRYMSVFREMWGEVVEMDSMLDV
ncbi:hypothetical protein HKX48_006275 [Thoreauomyces humboldtii]|nr:hypothetical protein HKX48_006275 [Thoreauomyces humboldtii]